MKMHVVLHIPKQPGQAYRCNLFQNRGIKSSNIITGSIPLVLRFLLPMIPREDAPPPLIGNCYTISFLIQMFRDHVGEKYQSC
jgi:hypothetical protein